MGALLDSEFQIVPGSTSLPIEVLRQEAHVDQGSTPPCRWGIHRRNRSPYLGVGLPLGNRSRNSRAETGEEVETLESTLPEDVVSQQDVVLEARRLVEPDHLGIALGDVGDHLVQSEVIEAVVEHEHFRVRREPLPPVVELTDEDRSELASTIAPVEVHDADGAQPASSRRPVGSGAAR